MSGDAILRINQVMAMVGLRRTTLWYRMREGSFPTAVQLGGHRMGWRESDVQRWINERPVNWPQKIARKAAALKKAAPASVSTPPIEAVPSPAPAPAKPKPAKASRSARREPPGQCSFSFD